MNDRSTHSPNTDASSTHSPLSRRLLLKSAGVLALGAGSVTAATNFAPSAAAQSGPGPILGTVLDYAAGVPSAASIKAAGHMGAVRYVSERRPGANWMLGKPVLRDETTKMAALGLSTASVYQFGRADSADWLRGAAGAAVHAPQAIRLHRAAGGPTKRPIYIAIDDNPSRQQYVNQIRPYLRAFAAALSAAGYQTGVYGNYNVVDWAVRDGIGQFFWMHDWGSGGKIHPRTTIHQLPRNKQRTIGGVVCDINNVYARDWGQWTPGQSPSTDNQAPGNNATPGNSSIPGLPQVNTNNLPSTSELQALSSDGTNGKAQTIGELLRFAQDNAHLSKQFGL